MFQGGGGVQITAEEDLVGLANLSELPAGETSPFESHLVDGAGSRGIAVDHHVGGDILNDLGTAPDDRVFTDLAKLMNGSETPDDGVVFDCDMTGQRADVGHDHVIADGDVVGYVSIGKNVIVGADGRAISSGCRTVDGDRFSDNVSIADVRSGCSFLPLEVLSFESNAGEGENFVLHAEAGVAINDNMGMEATSTSEFDMLADDAEGSDFAVVAYLCLGVYDRRGMNHVEHGLGISIR